MPLLPRALDDSRISIIAALTALGGHALVILAALWFMGPSRQAQILQGAISVTLVNAAPGAAHGPPTAPRQSVAPTSSPAVESRTENPRPSGERLDQLMAPTSPPVTPSPSLSASTSRASAASAGPPPGRHGAGSSQADQGLAAGEGAEGVDLYASASLPQVGMRPAAPSGPDLWSRVAPCWRAAAPRSAVLIVDLGGDGRLASAPMAVRRGAQSTDPQTLLAERAAFRALQACAPYEGLGGKRWRVSFP